MLNSAAPTLQELRLGGCRAPLGPQGSELLQRFLCSLEDLQVLELGNLGQVGLDMAGYGWIWQDMAGIFGSVVGQARRNHRFVCSKESKDLGIKGPMSQMQM